MNVLLEGVQGLFPYLRIWENSIFLNSVHIDLASQDNWSHRGHAPQRALYITNESPSKTISWTSTSLAKSNPVSQALASASTAPKGTSILLLRAASTLPLSSLMTTPRPVAFCFENVAPSTFTLKQSPRGGDHHTDCSLTGVSITSTSTAA